jgi:hypothetical protein
MKTSELRIGNWINYGHGREPQQIKAHDIYIGIEGRPFTPIEITEDWLNRLGIGNGKLMIWSSYWFSFRDSNTLYWESDDGTIFTIAYNIKSVHRLQNLIHALEEVETFNSL